uniref:microtubule-severing ATPase n=1 Tax=Lepeophtheirus salmonis TaxID=72036 RepID=A0A0K2VDA6_LEPSM
MSADLHVNEGNKWLSEALNLETSRRGSISVVLSYYRLGIRELESALALGTKDPRALRWLSQAYDRVDYLGKCQEEQKTRSIYPSTNAVPSAPPMESGLSRRKLYDQELKNRNLGNYKSPQRPSSSLSSHSTSFSSSSSSQKPPSELETFILSTKTKPQKSDSGFSSIAGLKSIKTTLQEIVILPSLRPDLFKGLRSPPRGILLFGPPGNGKTLLAKTLAAEGNMTLFSITASSLTSKYVGEGEKLMKVLFELALQNSPSLIFIDEVDSILCRRKEGEHEASRRLKNEFFSSFDSIVGNDKKRVLLIAATNRPQEIDDAALRRFTKKLFVPMPDNDTRKAVLTNLLSKNNSNLSEVELEILSGKVTKGYSCSDLTNLTKEAAFGPLRELSPEEITKVSPKDIRKIIIKDFEVALLKIRPSTNQSLLKTYEDWNKKYGDNS